MMKFLLVAIATWQASAQVPEDCPAERQTIVVLKDVADGWGDECKGLSKAESATDGLYHDAASCKKACEDDVKCAVWQFVEGGCWTGVPTSACRSREGFKADAGQRIQHGSIKVIKPATGMELMGLMAFKMTTGDDTVDAERCRLQCYSDVTCGVWQFAEQTATKGCWVEHKPEHARADSEPVNTTQFAKDVTHGEFVEHVCPPAKEEPPYNWWPLIGGIALAVIGLAILAYMLKKKPKTKKTRAVKIEPKKVDPAPVYFIPQPTVLVQQPLMYQPVPMTAPMTAMTQPMIIR